MTNQQEIPIKDQLNRTVEKLEESHSPLILKKAQQVILDMIEHNESTREALKITPELMGAFYSQGYKYFKGGKYNDALTIFMFLQALENSFNYHFATAACYQYLKRYDEAITSYLLCTPLAIDNPSPHFHIYDCFMKQNKPAPALQAIVTVLTLTKDKPAYAIMREKAVLEYKKLKETIKKIYS